MNIRDITAGILFLISLAIIIFIVTKVITVKLTVMGVMILSLFISLIAGMLSGSSTINKEFVKAKELIDKLKSEVESLKKTQIPLPV